MKSPQPGQEYLNYRAVLAGAVTQPPREWAFKRDPVYREILEHVSPEQGEAYLKLASSEFSQQWQDDLRWSIRSFIAINDTLGAPVVAYSEQLGFWCSPTNFRYLYHALLLLNQAKKHGDQHHFIELGGGYGGLAFYVLMLAPSFDISVLSYTTVDVPEACAIQEAVALEEGLAPFAAADGTDSVQLAAVVSDTALGSRFLISAYAFSEFSDSVQAWYQDLLVRHCDHGFLVWNLRPMFQFTSKPCVIEDERPLTGMGNKYVYF